MNVKIGEISIYVRCECGRYLRGDLSILMCLPKCECGNFDWQILSEDEYVIIERDKKINQITK